jgi:DNA-binding response OmpR family regulator
MDGAPLRILVVDDDRCIRELLKLHLSAEGYAVRVAEDGIAGGYAILQSAPDLLVVDVNMPHMDGIALVASIVADATVPIFPFIFLSSDETRLDQAYRLGAASYLLKPIVKDRFLHAVARALSRTRRPIPRPQSTTPELTVRRQENKTPVRLQA